MAHSVRPCNRLPEGHEAGRLDRRELMYSRGPAIVSNLQVQLDRRYSSWQVSDLRLEATGMEFVVCRGDSPKLGPLAFRVPWDSHFSNDNDESVDARDLLRQEAALASHVSAFGVATPPVRHLHIGNDGFDFLVYEFVVHDGSAPDPGEFGQLLREIHDCPVPDVKPVMQGAREIGDLIAERLLRRSRVIEEIAGMDLILPDPGCVRAVLARSTARPSLLHMDARPENLLTWRGNIRAVIDWSNALIGSPALDLARIEEYGQLTPEFLHGYGTNEAAEVPPSERLLYRLDTAVMLAVVFLSEAPNPTRAKSQIERAVSLLEAFRKHL